jgi:hypothetical protein
VLRYAAGLLRLPGNLLQFRLLLLRLLWRHALLLRHLRLSGSLTGSLRDIAQVLHPMERRLRDSFLREPQVGWQECRPCLSL